MLQVNETFLLKLGESYDWNIIIDDQTIVSRVVNVLVVKGAQGIYRAYKRGNATLTAAYMPKIPAFESILPISMVLAALLFRRKKLKTPV